jgi:fermentation-respiration switch protein FrsA (DUF1100 family)
LILHILISCAAGYIVLLLGLYLLQSRLVYHPTRPHEAHPGDLGMEYEHVRFPSADGVELDAFFTPARESRGVVLFCHGNGGNISHRIDTIWILHEMGFDSLFFDYRGYGRSQGKPDEPGTYLDAEAAWDYLTQRRRYKPEQILVQGRSLGGPIAAHLAAREQPAGLILESTFTCVADMASGMYWFAPVRWLCRFEYDTKAYLAKVDCPVLILHSREDQRVSFSHGDQLFQAAGEPKRFVELIGGHNDGFAVSGAIYTDALESFATDLAGLERP